MGPKSRAAFIAFVAWFVLTVGKSVFDGNRIIPAKPELWHFILSQIIGATLLAVSAFFVVGLWITLFGGPQE